MRIKKLFLLCPLDYVLDNHYHYHELDNHYHELDNQEPLEMLPTLSLNTVTLTKEFVILVAHIFLLNYRKQLLFSLNFVCRLKYINCMEN